MPYGETRWGGLGPTDFGYTAQRSEGFGLYDYNARYYSGVLGRFISPDTVVPEPENPQAFNKYSYVTNNPLKYTDPSGHEGCSGSGEMCIDFWKPLREMWESAPEVAPKVAEEMAVDAVESAVDSVKFVSNTASKLLPDAIVIGGSASANLGAPGSSIDMGWEVVLNFNSAEVTGFRYDSPGVAYGASATLTGYGGAVWNLPENSAYSGSFESVSANAAAGEGATFTYFWAPDDEPGIGAFTPNNAKGFAVGYGLGAGGSVSYNQTEYEELFELNFQKDSPEEKIIPPEEKKDKRGL